jgi:hypothetical protein
MPIRLGWVIGSGWVVGSRQVELGPVQLGCRIEMLGRVVGLSRWVKNKTRLDDEDGKKGDDKDSKVNGPRIS